MLLLIMTYVATGCSAPDDPDPVPVTKDTIRVLAIGNSFSEDALQYVYDLAGASDRDVILGNLFYGNCSLAQHWLFIKQKSAVYDYQKNENGAFSHNYNSTLQKGLTDEKWDVITIQQYSAYSGMIDTYFPYLDSIVAYVKQNATNAGMKLALHQTWAYPAYSTLKDFENYGNNQLVMYGQIVTVVKEVAARQGIILIIPSGTAIQNARSYFGDTLNRDGSHLTNSLGRYIASCTWFESLTGVSSVGNSFRPLGVSYTDASVAQVAAHSAILKPDEVTNISGL